MSDTSKENPMGFLLNRVTDDHHFFPQSLFTKKKTLLLLPCLKASNPSQTQPNPMAFLPYKKSNNHHFFPQLLELTSQTTPMPQGIKSQ